MSGPVLGVLFVMINTIQAMGAAMPSLILSISRQGLLYIPIVFSFSYLYDSPKMLVMAQPITDYLTVALSLILYFISFKKLFHQKMSN